MEYGEEAIAMWDFFRRLQLMPYLIDEGNYEKATKTSKERPDIIKEEFISAMKLNGK